MYAFAVAVNRGNTAINGELIKDIPFNENLTYGEGLYYYKETLHRWTPIGTHKNPYVGTFDGAGYSVNGLCIDEDTKETVGFFGVVGEGGTVKNVSVIDSYLRGRKSDNIEQSNKHLHAVGSIAAINYGTVESCHSDSTLWGGQGCWRNRW